MKEFTFSLLMLFAIGSFAQQRPFVTMQYAGSIGYISLGGGITSKSQKVQHELLYGFVPKAYGGPLDKITYKFTYLPANWHLSQRVAWRPLNVSGFAAYNVGRNFSLQPSFKKYHEDYYWWSPALRFHLGFSTALELTHKKSPNKGLLYIEANTNDRYITTWWDNTSKLKLHDIFFLGMGMKVILN
jgi:hypothetical protein